jgi:hypothetical protein
MLADTVQPARILRVRAIITAQHYFRSARSASVPYLEVTAVRRGRSDGDTTARFWDFEMGLSERPRNRWQLIGGVMAARPVLSIAARAAMKGSMQRPWLYSRLVDGMKSSWCVALRPRWRRALPMLRFLENICEAVSLKQGRQVPDASAEHEVLARLRANTDGPQTCNYSVL